MAKDLSPAFAISGWTSDGTDITIPIASLSGLEAADADPTTGDIRNVLLALLKTLVAQRDGLADADKPSSCVVSMTPIDARTYQFQARFKGVADTILLEAEPA